jgi:hypothetical protein
MTPTQIMEAQHRLLETMVKALGGLAAAVEDQTPQGRA